MLEGMKWRRLAECEYAPAKQKCPRPHTSKRGTKGNEWEWMSANGRQKVMGTPWPGVVFGREYLLHVREKKRKEEEKK